MIMSASYDTVYFHVSRVAQCLVWPPAGQLMILQSLVGFPMISDYTCTADAPHGLSRRSYARSRFVTTVDLCCRSAVAAAKTLTAVSVQIPEPGASVLH